MSTGISEPLSIVAAFGFRDAESASLSDVARLDKLVTVVGARIVETNQSDVPADADLDAELFDVGTAREHPMSAKGLYGFAVHVPDLPDPFPPWRRAEAAA